MAIRYKLSGKVMAVLVASDPESLVSSRRTQVHVTLDGFEGDKHSGMTHPSDGRTPQYPPGTEIRNSRQVSIVSAEELSQISTAMGIPEILPEWMGANLLLSQVPGLTHLPPRTRLFFSSGAVLLVENENRPCIYPGKIIQNQYSHPGLDELFIPAALHRRGLVACVERAGMISEGDEVRVETPEQTIYDPFERGERNEH